MFTTFKFHKPLEGYTLMHNNNLNIKNTYIWLSIIQRRLELVTAQGDFDVIIKFALYRPNWREQYLGI